MSLFQKWSQVPIFKEVDFDALTPGQLWRFTLNLKDNTVERKLEESPLL